MNRREVPRAALRGRRIRVETEIAAKRESRSRPDAGIVDFIHGPTGRNGVLVAECRRQAFMRKRPAEA